MDGVLNGRSHYRSDFDWGKFGIWWCGNFWMIGTSKLGTCGGVAYNGQDETCVHNVGWNWKYSNVITKGWIEAGEGLGVKCKGYNSFK